MIHHAAFGLPVESFDVVLVEDSKPMQAILRSILMSVKVGRVRAFDNAVDALESMLIEPPNVIITDWRMAPVSGYRLMRTIRHRSLEPLCFVPVIFITAHGTKALVDKVMRGGAHFLLVKPVAPAILLARLQSLSTDNRHFELLDSHYYGLTGAAETFGPAEDLRERRVRRQALHRHAVQRAGQFQNLVDKIFKGEIDLDTVLDGDPYDDIEFRPAADDEEPPREVFAGVKVNKAS